MDTVTAFHFYSVPPTVWHQDGIKSEESTERFEPERQAPSHQSLARIEFRGQWLKEACHQLSSGSSRPALLAQSPGDLPALLRTADQLLAFSRDVPGAAAKVWLCSCGARLAGGPMLIRPTSIRCSHCGKTVDIEVTREEKSPNDPVAIERVSLSVFFRESMARGWPVLVAARPLKVR